MRTFGRLLQFANGQRRIKRGRALTPRWISHTEVPRCVVIYTIKNVPADAPGIFQPPCKDSKVFFKKKSAGRAIILHPGGAEKPAHRHYTQSPIGPREA